MAVEAGAVAGMIREALPEFAALVDEHVSEWGDEPMLYILAGGIFQELCDIQDTDERVSRLSRVYSFVDRALVDGSDSVRDCFAIEFVEPLTGFDSGQHYPNFEAALGPQGKRELADMREWWRRYEAVVERLNTQAGRCVLGDIGIGRVEESELRVIANEKEWNSISDVSP